MSRQKTEFQIGDRIQIVSDRKCTGVVVFKQDQNPNDIQWSIHLYNCAKERGFYKTNEIEKIMPTKVSN